MAVVAMAGGGEREGAKVAGAVEKAVAADVAAMEVVAMATAGTAAAWVVETARVG